jgi:hypothetical protein
MGSSTNDQSILITRFDGYVVGFPTRDFSIGVVEFDVFFEIEAGGLKQFIKWWLREK